MSHFGYSLKKVKLPASIIAVILLIVATYFNDAPFHEWLQRAFYPFGMIAFINLIDSLIDKESRCDKLCRLSATVYCIYAAQEIYILGWSKGLFLRIFGESLAKTLVRFFTVPLVVVCVCLVLYYLFNSIIPRILAFACGGRT